MKKGCLITIAVVVGGFFSLIAIGVIWGLFKAEELESAAETPTVEVIKEEATSAPVPVQKEKTETETATVEKEPESSASETTELGKWEYKLPPGFTVFVLRTKRGITFRQNFKDGRTTDEEMNPTTSPEGIRFLPVEKNDFGEFWLLDTEMDLSLYDADGLIEKTKRLDRKMDFATVNQSIENLIEEPEPKQGGTIFDTRKWTSADETKTFIGELTKLGDGEVTVEKEDGPITFPIYRLSEADREFLGQGITITTLDTKTHKNVSVARISADSILFKKESGPVSIPMDLLPVPFRSRFGYDPVIAAKMREAREKQAKALRERQQAAAAQERAESNLDTFMGVLEGAGVGNDLITYYSTKGETITLTVATGWHYQPKQARQQTAQILWQTWAMIYSPNDLDKARLSLVDAVGNRVGGSRILAGSLIWVDD